MGSQAQSVADCVRGHVMQRLGRPLTVYRVTHYATQVTTGRNYFLKVRRTDAFPGSNSTLLTTQRMSACSRLAYGLSWVREQQVDVGDEQFVHVKVQKPASGPLQFVDLQPDKSAADRLTSF